MPKKYEKVLLFLCSVVVPLFFLEKVFPSSGYLLVFALVIDSCLAVGVGYWIILLDEHEKLIRCSMLSATIGIIRFILALPGMLLFRWDSGHDFVAGLSIFVVSSAISIGVFAILGLFGGKLRQISNSKEG